MIDQEKIVQDFIAAETASWLEEDLMLMQKKFSAGRPAIIHSLAAAIESLCRDAAGQQAAGCKGAGACICISFLRTNILDNIWQYRLDLYDETLFLDRTECTADWEMDFVFDPIKKLLDGWQDNFQSGLVANKIKPRHLKNVRLKLAADYHGVAIGFTQNIIAEALKNSPAYQELNKAPGFAIVMGEYCDQTKLIYEEE
ncbi:Hypothetical protein LUCI_4316 [Lucifera butyrica]|uniref:Uncharacterized protein n=1 Tax=Lucifera butyrica TaxID=1351585 RepID=A0A498RDX9_9FIRM|nr:hypothetical protein [Lucifera butyrica]VBB09030.1 Hypothetical protein LUCI_4316 [Lucifera butyrica]